MYIAMRDARQGAKEVNYVHSAIHPIHPAHLSEPSSKRQSLTSLPNNSRLNLAGTKQTVLVRHTVKRTRESRILRAPKVIILAHSIARISRIQRLARANKLVRLDEHLGAVAGVDAVGDALEVAVVDVAGAEADRRGARVDVAPVVVGVGDAQVALVFGAVVVAVAYQRGFPVVVDVAVGDGYVVGGVGELYRQFAISLERYGRRTSIRPS
jgi:hypothetical protein